MNSSHTRTYVFLTGSIAALLLLAGGHGQRISLAQSDSTPPSISKVKIIELTDTSATVIWKTDEDADSLINYGLDKQYGIVRDPLPDKVEHVLVLDELEPSTTYHFRVVSVDAIGNQSISGDYVLTTQGVQDIEDIEQVESREQQALVEQAVAIIDKITDEKALTLVADKLAEAAEGILLPPTVIGKPTIEANTNTAIVTWTTDRPANSVVFFASEDEYDPFADDPYVFSQGNPNELVSNHRVEVIGLEPSTTYHLQATSKGEFDITGKSEDTVFTTKSVLPEIYNLSIGKVEETSATIVWNTTVPASGLVEYKNLGTEQEFSKGNPAYTTDHSIRIADLTLGTRYQVVVAAENVGGDKIRSEPLTFVTVKDEFPPVISKVTNESTLFPGAEARIQTIVSWQSDEPSVCDFHFRQGLAPGLEDTVLPRQDDNYLEKHVQVIVDFTPSTVYLFWVTCEDPSGNKTRSEDFVLFTPEKEKSIIDIIIENFEGTFGWIKDIGK